MTEFYGQDLAAVHAEAFEALAAAAAETVLSVNPQLRHSGLVLDLGCGAGPLSQRLRARGLSTWGLDISPALIALARQRLPEAEFHCGTILSAKLPTAAAATAIGEVLNYVTDHDPDDLTRVFERVFDALEPGGVFLFDIAAPGRIGSARAFTEGSSWAVGVVAEESGEQLVRRITTFRKLDGESWSRSYEEHRLRLWAPDRIKDELGACGFQVDQLSNYEGITMPAALHVYLATKPG